MTFTQEMGEDSVRTLVRFCAVCAGTGVALVRVTVNDHRRED